MGAVMMVALMLTGSVRAELDGFEDTPELSKPRVEAPGGGAAKRAASSFAGQVCTLIHPHPPPTYHAPDPGDGDPLGSVTGKAMCGGIQHITTQPDCSSRVGSPPLTPSEDAGSSRSAFKRR